MTTGDEEERIRRENGSRLHSEIWDASISPGLKRADQVFEVRKTKPPEHLLHFTSASALAAILPSRTLRLSRARSSNDPKELDHAIALAREELRTVTRDQADGVFRDELFASLAGRLTDGTERYSIDPHVCCFTEADSADVVAHWAMYGRDGSGFALRFKGDALGEKPDVTLAKVAYQEDEQRSYIRELLRIGRDTSQRAAVWANEAHGEAWAVRSFRIAAHAFGGIISLHAATMKAPEFAAEKEWRLVHPGVSENPDVRPGIEAKGAVLRTFFDMRFEPEDLVAVIVGPVHADLNRPIVWKLLEQHGYTTTRVETGKVALRTLRGDR